MDALSRRSGNTDYGTLNTHEIVTEKRNPELVRGRSGVGTDQIRRKWGAFIDGIKVSRKRIIWIHFY